MTLSIAAQDARTGMLGAAISSSSIAVASRCVWGLAGVGLVLTQNVTNPELGPLGLDLMEGGLQAPRALEQLLDWEQHPEYRQLTVVDAEGMAAHHSGEKCLGRHAYALGEHCLAAGNLLASEGVPQAMAEAFKAAQGHLAARLLAALEAGLAAGGEEGPLRSAGLLVVHEQRWPIVDLRVDWDEAPIARLAELWRLYEPQLPDYILRATNPTAAPSFGVPGDE